MTNRQHSWLLAAALLLSGTTSQFALAEDLDANQDPGKIDLSKPDDRDDASIFDYALEAHKREERRHKREEQHKADLDSSSNTSGDDDADNKTGPDKFAGEKFSDTDFSKYTYRDFLIRKFQKDIGNESSWGESGNSSKDDDNKEKKKADDKKRDDKKDDKKKHAFDDNKDRLKEMREEFWRELTTPHYETAGDWVPDKMDPLQAGGFGTSPDNGAPVPFRLNGHVNIQRGLPWDIKD